MEQLNLQDLADSLAETVLKEEGVSFQGQSLKLDTAEDAKEIITAIDNCKNLTYLNLEGNTLGVEAAKAIAKSLEKHPELKRALWKDLFTGRMKSEIPIALEYLGNALVKSGAKLIELDMSDNAFGPVGVKGLATLLRSPSCYNLQELRLNNNGLGITGGSLLAKSLLDCYNNSKSHGKPLALRVFIAGRNRLENEGAKALAEVFKTLGSLEEVQMPQNGIYHRGISALSEAFANNANLRIINLNDNTIGPKGSRALAQALPNLQKLEEINFGDCLLKTKGAMSLADALITEHVELRNLTFGFNEIRAEGGLALAKAVHNKQKLKSLVLGGNQFGEKGRENVESELKNTGLIDKLGSLSEDESEPSESEDEELSDENSLQSCKDDDDDDDDDADEVTFNDDENSNNEKVTINKHNESDNNDVSATKPAEEHRNLTIFLENPTSETYLGLGALRNKIILNKVQSLPNADVNGFLSEYIPILMKISALSTNEKVEVSQEALACSVLLYKELFSWLQKTRETSLLNNSILVHLGLIKSEEKTFKPTWDIEGCMFALNESLKQSYFPQETKDVLKLFIERLDLNNYNSKSSRKLLYTTLHT